MSDPIQVDSQIRYIAEQSNPSERQYVYSYTIRISNHGEQAAQLISRHWVITDAENQVQEVQGLGVIGKQPTIEPGESYSYTSGVIIETPTGIMAGSYKMQNPDGDTFQAEIPPFALVQPQSLH